MQILPHEGLESLIEIPFPAIDIVYFPPLEKFQEPASAEAEGEVGAIETFFLLPDVDVVGCGVIPEPRLQIADRHFTPSEESGALVDGAVVIDDQVVGGLDHAGSRRHPGRVEATLQDLVAEKDARLGKPRLVGGDASVVELGIALLDVIMPKRNGSEVYREIARVNPDIKVLFMSGYTQDVIDWKESLEEGIRLVPKPVRPDELLMRIRELLEG
jgi:CheY-like chemotaxis protein